MVGLRAARSLSLFSLFPACLQLCWVKPAGTSTPRAGNGTRAILFPLPPLCAFQVCSLARSPSVLPWEHRGQPGCSSSLKIPHPAARSSLPLAARPRSAAGKAAGGLPAAAMPRKAGLSRLVAGPVTLALLAAELMKAPKLRELASASLPSPLPGEGLGFGLIPGCRGEAGGQDGTWSGDRVSSGRLPSPRDVWGRDGAELVRSRSGRLGACWGRGLLGWHPLVLVPLGKDPTLTGRPLGWLW